MDFYIPKDNSTANQLYKHNTDKKEKVWKIKSSIYLYLVA